ncbi:MAG: DNA (cytosine-5-)-methyltransferase [Rhodospirillaceae bacterium]|nr:DNA (cytosine-5-)-methyltransferase [Rhodospirillaceae bacterium]
MKAAEFFAGMGLMRAGLERCGIETVFANDVDATKAALYRENWGRSEFRKGDIRDLYGSDIPDADIATASFPCVDLSLAGYRAGLEGTRSGVVFEFMRILGEMRSAPPIVLLENVPGFLTANGGRDFEAVVRSLEGLGYRVRHISVDAAAFVPQSRVRVFVIGCRDIDPPLLPKPPERSSGRLADIVRDEGTWWGAKRMACFLGSLSDLQAERVDAFQRQSHVSCHGAYRRTRKGKAVWEVRADEIAGALRTTAGGSGRQAVLRVGNGDFAARWMDVPEYAALQGADGMTWESVSPRQAMYAFGDAVCVPVVEWIAKHALIPAHA